MTSTVQQGPALAAGPRSWLPSRWQVVIAVVAAFARLPFVNRPLSPDEGGFLAVAHQWQVGGGSLYGSAWVDRPPLLITIFSLADRLGGVVPLRIIGCVAVAITVLAGSQAARLLLRSDRAGLAAAVTAAALLGSSVAGALTVNGELLAAPFVALGLLAMAAALRTRTWRGTVVAGVASGAGAVAAVLVKQNMVDVAIVAMLLAFVAIRRRAMTGERVRAWLLGAVAGAAAFSVVVLGWAAAHGTSLTGLFYAMYPFRAAASHVLATSTSDAAHVRGWALFGRAVVSGIVPAAVVGLAVLVFGRRAAQPARDRLDERDVLVVAVAWMAWCGVSIVLGGNFWSHYLVQLVLPTAVAVGALAVRYPRSVRALVVLVVSMAIVGSGLTARSVPDRQAELVGHGIRRTALSDDSVIVVWGHANLLQATGLRSPYPYWWSLPAKTLDPRLRRLHAVLTGPAAPTWVVTGPRLKTWGLDTRSVAGDLGAHYRRVAQLCGESVYLRDDANRPVPVDPCITAPQEKS